jgi:hypothetical protein
MDTFDKIQLITQVRADQTVYVLAKNNSSQRIMVKVDVLYITTDAE